MRFQHVCEAPGTYSVAHSDSVTLDCTWLPGFFLAANPPPGTQRHLKSGSIALSGSQLFDSQFV